MLELFKSDHMDIVAHFYNVGFMFDWKWMTLPHHLTHFYAILSHTMHIIATPSSMCYKLRLSWQVYWLHDFDHQAHQTFPTMAPDHSTCPPYKPNAQLYQPISHKLAIYKNQVMRTKPNQIAYGLSH